MTKIKSEKCCVLHSFTEFVSTKSIETCIRLIKIIKTDLTMLIIL